MELPIQLHYGIVNDQLSERAIEVLLAHQCNVSLVESLDQVPHCGIVYLSGEGLVKKWPSRFLRHVILQHHGKILLGIALRDNHRGNFEEAVLNAARAAEACLSPNGLPTKFREMPNPWLSKSQEKDTGLSLQLRRVLSARKGTHYRTPSLWKFVETKKSRTNWRSLHHAKIRERHANGFTN
jgi:hypothetical protein